jgi:hypothetical protein
LEDKENFDIDTDLDWQTGLVFTGLKYFNETYLLYARSQANENFNAGPPAILEMNTDRAPGVAVDAPRFWDKTVDSITVIENRPTGTSQLTEFLLSTTDVKPEVGDPRWSVSGIFTGLQVNSVYYLFARSQENADYYTGEASESTMVRTFRHGENITAKATLESLTHNRITVNPIGNGTAASGQQIEYALSDRADRVPVSGWSTSRTFVNLEPDTVYYVYARAARCLDLNFEAGNATVSDAFTTAQARTGVSVRDRMAASTVVVILVIVVTSVAVCGLIGYAVYLKVKKNKANAE